MSIKSKNRVLATCIQSYAEEGKNYVKGTNYFVWPTCCAQHFNIIKPEIREWT